MARTGRPGLSQQQRDELWQRWKEGQSLSRALGKHAASVFGVLPAKGGVAPRMRLRKTGSLSQLEREEISRSLVAGFSYCSIGRLLGRAPSTISREVARNGSRKTYRALSAESNTLQRSFRPKLCVLAVVPSLQMLVAEKLKCQWSLQQISGWLKVEHPGDRTMQVSHETIYKSLFIQAPYSRRSGVLKKELLAHLRSHRIMRRGKTSSTSDQTRGQIIDAISVRDRPAEIEDRAMPGHWEGDLLSGAKNTHIATLVERTSRFVMLVRLDGKDSQTVIDALVRKVRELPRGLMTSLTWDRGTELAYHKKFTVATDAKVYFCDPQSPWQRGSNENTNGLLRQYFPNGTDLSAYDQDALDHVALSLNTRPRKTLGFLTPANKLKTVVALTD